MTKASCQLRYAPNSGQNHDALWKPYLVDPIILYQMSAGKVLAASVQSNANSVLAIGRSNNCGAIAMLETRSIAKRE